MNWFAAVAGCVAVGSAWEITTPRPGRRRGGLEWVLLACMVGVGVLSVLALNGLVGVRPINALVFVGLAAGLELAARLLVGSGYPQPAKLARVAMIGAAAGLALTPFTSSSRIEPLAKILGLALTSTALILVSKFASHAEVVAHGWWLDNGASIPEEWVSLLVHKDGHAEVISAEGQLARFHNQTEALRWLEQKGYIPGQVAVQRGLVAAEPPWVFPLKSTALATPPRR